MAKRCHILLNTAQISACHISLPVIILDKAVLGLQPACSNGYTTDVITCSGYFLFKKCEKLEPDF